MERIKISRVVNGKKYNTENATLVAHNVFWDGSNFERRGRNTWLYRTPRGAWFTVNGTFWQGERDTLEPINESDAQDLYEGPLTEHEIEWSEAFGREPVEPEPGRPPLYGETMGQTAVRLPPEMVEWLKEQPGGMAETVRNLVKSAMES